jgi:esterase FrsA
MTSIPLHPSFEIAYTGPDLSAGPLPALFYFALSAQDSLRLDPFNQPVAYLSSLPMRIFSMTLPGHENQLPPTEALHVWAQEMARGHNFVADFAQKVKMAVEMLQDVLIADRIAVAGLSRGAFIATHAAAVTPQLRWILGFAPLTQLAFAKEFHGLQGDPTALMHLAPQLFDRQIRFYIGNLDTRVGTRKCFDFVEKVANAAFEANIRSPKVELIIGPSIGRDGHGTSKEVFHDGAQWIAEKLGAVDVV